MQHITRYCTYSKQHNLSKFYTGMTSEQFWARLVKKLGYFQVLCGLSKDPRPAQKAILGQFGAGPEFVLYDLSRYQMTLKYNRGTDN